MSCPQNIINLGLESGTHSVALYVLFPLGTFEHARADLGAQVPTIACVAVEVHHGIPGSKSDAFVVAT